MTLIYNLHSNKNTIDYGSQAHADMKPWAYGSERNLTSEKTSNIVLCPVHLFEMTLNYENGYWWRRKFPGLLHDNENVSKLVLATMVR